MFNSKDKTNNGKETLEGVNLMMHALPEKLPYVLKLLPKTKPARIKKIAGKKWYNILTFCTKKEARRLIPKLKNVGCEDIVEFPAIFFF